MIFLSALSLAPPALAAPGSTLNHHMDQAEHFLHRGWLEDAEAEYQAALQLPGASTSYDLLQLGARIAWQMLEVEQAMLRTQASAALAPLPELARAARSAAEGYAQDFGFVVLKGSHPGVRSRIELESQSMILDPDLSRYGHRLAARLVEPTQLPSRFALPVGTWTLNGVELKVEPSGEHEVALPKTALGQRAWMALGVSRLEISGGMNLWAGESLDHTLPSPSIQLGWLHPAGPMLVDLNAGLNWTWYLNDDSRLIRESPDLRAGLHVGYEIPNRSPLTIRPSLGLAYQEMSVLMLECRTDEACWSCTAPGLLSDPQAEVYSDGWALLPGLSIALDYRARGLRTAPGSGIRLSLDHARGVTTEQDPDSTRSQAETVDWTASSHHWSGWQFRIQAGLSWAF